MRYFATTYMAVVIRCFELKVFDEDDFETKLYQRAEMKGHELVEWGLITEEDLEYRLEELRMTYERLKEGNSYGEDTDKVSGIS